MIDTFIPFIESLARASREIILPYFRASFASSQKADATPVTEADLRAEELLRERIRRAYPDHGIIGEEFGKERDDAEFVWVLDPIDGTKTFMHGVPLFGTLIALCRDGEPVLGAIDLCALDQLIIGTGESTTLNGERVRMRDVPAIEEATVLTTDPLMIGKYKTIAGFHSLVTRAKLYRTWGDCYGYALLVAGYADVMIDPIMSAWDSLALIPIIRGAGGIITDYEGNDPVRGTSIVAAGKSIHHEVVRVLNAPR